jgi:hypothetical protein
MTRHPANPVETMLGIKEMLRQVFPSRAFRIRPGWREVAVLWDGVTPSEAEVGTALVEGGIAKPSRPVWNAAPQMRLLCGAVLKLQRRPPPNCPSENLSLYFRRL